MDERSSRAFWITHPGTGALRAETVPEPATGELGIRALHSGISRGTESLVWHGRIPESQHDRMRAPFQAGSFPAPVKYGYASVGVVEAGPNEWRGQTVFCLYPHQSRYTVPADAVQPLPATLPPERAVLAANTETALNICWDAAPRAGERISVIGAGVVGALTAALCAEIPGTEVELVDINPARRFLADPLGVEFAHPDDARGDNDRVIHASGSEDGLALALRVAADEATLVEASWFGDRQPRVPLGEAFHSGRLTLRASQVGQISPAMRPRWGHARRLGKALALLADHPRWDCLIDGETAFDKLPEAMADIVNGSGLCHRINY
ncbi:zinc-dependent alcohol dehydrogenase [Spiribacter vilamensis]|uniref:Threonine dehydrogenase-like Zn-dependent dehydrogenase n=1 Tax=Spiribacter vilamensis TaxID=531306 RepID=A0A4Q8CYL2_9GAMM|nr:zinc-binding alcohol dehydrogenase [Spiribacter vilamensis]RZU98073.1 threonine dehydrogenase-like Zn-dependent dehydrogenase [Spiribacter vilamensis]TVO61025.1 zinc-binding alcohol dehydrogenase [Spiribacter vilamensis]